MYNVEKSVYDIKLNTLKKNISSAFYNLKYINEKIKAYKELDSLYSNFSNAAKRKFELGETNYLEMITAESKHRQIELHLNKSKTEATIVMEKLKTFIQLDTIIIDITPLKKVERKTLDIQNNLGYLFYENNKTLSQAVLKKEKQNLLPDITLDYFEGSNSTLNSSLRGYQLGLKIPLLFGSTSSKIKMAKIANQVAEDQQENFKINYRKEYTILTQKINQLTEELSYYESYGNKVSREILKTANSSYKYGEIDFFQYIQSIENAIDIELAYLENLNAYNQTILSLNYLTF